MISILPISDNISRRLLVFDPSQIIGCNPYVNENKPKPNSVSPPYPHPTIPSQEIYAPFF